MRCSEQNRSDQVGPKIHGQNQQSNDEVGPVFTGGWVHSLSGVTARRAGVSVITVDRIEKGKLCRIDTKRKIVKALGFNPWLKE
jgi:hypothetical protein